MRHLFVILLVLAGLASIPASASEDDAGRSHHPRYHAHQPTYQWHTQGRHPANTPYGDQFRNFGKPDYQALSRPHTLIIRPYGQPPPVHQGHQYGVQDRIRIALDGRYLESYQHDRRLGRLYLRPDERWERRHQRVYVRGPHQLEAYSNSLSKRGRLFLRPRASVQFGRDEIVVRYDRVEERYSLDLHLQSRQYR